MQKSYNIQSINGKQVITEVNNTRKSKKTTLKLIIGVILGVSLFFAGRISSNYRIAEDYSVVSVSYYSTDEQIYNQGYRSGSMDRLAQLIECDGVTDQAVLRDYHIVSETLEKMGELDTTPYPCTE